MFCTCDWAAAGDASMQMTEKIEELVFANAVQMVLPM